MPNGLPVNSGSIVCEICGKPVDPHTEQVMLKWHEPKQWWVYYHLRVIEPGSSRFDYEASYQLGSEAKYGTHCARAGYNPRMERFD